MGLLFRGESIWECANAYGQRSTTGSVQSNGARWLYLELAKGRIQVDQPLVDVDVLCLASNDFEAFKHVYNIIYSTSFNIQTAGSIAQVDVLADSVRKDLKEAAHTRVNCSMGSNGTARAYPKAILPRVLSIRRVGFLGMVTVIWLMAAPRDFRRFTVYTSLSMAVM